MFLALKIHLLCLGTPCTSTVSVARRWKPCFAASNFGALRLPTTTEMTIARGHCDLLGSLPLLVSKEMVCQQHYNNITLKLETLHWIILNPLFSMAITYWIEKTTTWALSRIYAGHQSNPAQEPAASLATHWSNYGKILHRSCKGTFLAQPRPKGSAAWHSLAVRMCSHSCPYYLCWTSVADKRHGMTGKMFKKDCNKMQKDMSRFGQVSFCLLFLWQLCPGPHRTSPNQAAKCKSFGSWNMTWPSFATATC